MTYVSELSELKNRCVDYIKSVLNFRGTNYEVTDPANYEDEFNDELYRLPRGFYVTKYGQYIEYAIVMIDIENDVLSFRGIEIGEMGDEETLTVNDLTTDSICSLADLVKSLEG